MHSSIVLAECMQAAVEKLKAERANPPPSEECFCYIWGTSTWAQLLKTSAFVEDGDSEQEYDFDTLYDDYGSCSEGSLASVCFICLGPEFARH